MARHLNISYLLIFFTLFFYSQRQIQAQPIEEFKAFDCPNDSGKQICLTWKKLQVEKSSLTSLSTLSQFLENLIKRYKEDRLISEFKNLLVEIRKIQSEKGDDLNSIKLLSEKTFKLLEKHNLENEFIFLKEGEEAREFVIYLVSGKSRNSKIKLATVTEATQFKADNPKFFGWSEDNKNYHLAIISEINVPLDKALEFTSGEQIVNFEQVEFKDLRQATKETKKLYQEVKANIENILIRGVTIASLIKAIDAQIEKISNRDKKLIKRTIWLNILEDYRKYKFQLQLKEGNKVLFETPVVEGYSKPQLIDTSTGNVFFSSIIIGFIIVFCIIQARKNPNVYIRRIPGIDAVEEAVGRATEMGKSVLFLTGLNPISTLSTIAAVSILARVAKKIAQYESKLIVPCCDPITMAVVKETVKAAYQDVGRPDMYREENIFFVTDRQFPFVAAVDGIMMRERPAANIFMGYYYAESLLLAETGTATNAIQIAGTDAVTQLPFFVTTCDFTIIGEELYAAGAYASRNPLQLGSLKGQDIGKLVLFIILILGAIVSSAGSKALIHLFTTFGMG